MTTETQSQPTAQAKPAGPRFELTNQPIKITALGLPTKKHREGVIRTVDIAFIMEGGNQLLNLFDPVLLDMLYKPVETDADQLRHKQIQIEELDEGAPKPLLRCQNFRFPLRLGLEYTGYTLTIDRGMGDHVSGGKNVTSNIVIAEATFKGFGLTPKEGGSVELRGHIQATNMEDEDIGRLSHFIKRETKITAKAPVVKQATIDGTKAAFDKDHPSAAAGGSVIDAELETGATKTRARPKASDRAVAPAKKTAKPKPDPTGAFLGQHGAAGAGKH